MDYFVPFAAMQWEAQYAAGPALLLIWHCSMSTLDRKYWMMKIFKASSNLWMRWKLVANHLYIFFQVKIFACVGVFEAWAGQAIVSQCKLCHLTMIGRDLCKILWNDFHKTVTALFDRMKVFAEDEEVMKRSLTMQRWPTKWKRPRGWRQKLKIVSSWKWISEKLPGSLFTHSQLRNLDQRGHVYAAFRPYA